MKQPHDHATHPAPVARFKRADGHLRAVIATLEGGKPCLDTAQLVQSVVTAVANARRSVLHGHMDHCRDEIHFPANRDEIGAIAR